MNDKMEIMNGGKALMKALEREGVKEVFGLPGGANLPMYDELYKSNIRHILVRHEQSSAHMADGFGRVSRKPGVCFATSGPGATNLLTGIATAQADSAPMVAVTGQVPVNMIGRDAFQESDIIGMSNPSVKYAFQPRTVEEIPEVVKKGFYIAETGRPGPVLLDIPKDVQQNEAKVTFPDEVRVPGYHPWTDVDMVNIERAIDLLLSSEKPIILAGGGTIISSAFAELQSIAEMLMIPVVTTFKGKGSFPENHPLSLGPIGMHGHAEANKIMTEVDCVLAIGTRFSDRSVGTFEEFERNLKIIHMDVDPAEIGKNQTAQVAVVGDVKASLRVMLKLLAKKVLKKSDGNNWLKHVKEVKDYWRENLKLHPGEMSAAKILRKLREVLPKESIVTTEVGQHQMWAAQHYKFDKPNHWMTSGGLGTMGYGLPAAVGVQVAHPNKLVVDIAGEASVLMTMQEMSTAVQYSLPIKIFILNNEYMGMVRQWQELLHEKNYSESYTAALPDFVKLAEAYGCVGIRAKTPDELDDKIIEMINTDRPVIFDCMVDKEENCFPMIPSGKPHNQMLLGPKDQKENKITGKGKTLV